MSSIQELEPVYTEIPLEPYCAQGRLFPSEESQDNFWVHVWRLWKRVPGDFWQRRPYIFRFDFEGVTHLELEETDLTFAFVWSHCLGQAIKPVFSVFENVAAVWPEFRSLPTFRGHRAVVVRGRAEDQYRVVGNAFIGTHVYDRILPQLPTGQWFQTGDVPGEIFNGANREEVIDNMHNLGLLLRAEIAGGRRLSSYRTLV